MFGKKITLDAGISCKSSLKMIFFSNSKIRYRSNATKDWKMLELNNDLYEAKIQNLSPGETYDVMVLSQNDNGDGMFSKTVRVTTKSKPQIGFQTNLSNIVKCFINRYMGQSL